MMDLVLYFVCVHLRLDSHFLIGQNEILLNVIKVMLLAADRGLVI